MSLVADLSVLACDGRTMKRKDYQNFKHGAAHSRAWPPEGMACWAFIHGELETNRRKRILLGRKPGVLNARVKRAVWLSMGEVFPLNIFNPARFISARALDKALAAANNRNPRPGDCKGRKGPTGVLDIRSRLCSAHR